MKLVPSTAPFKAFPGRSLVLRRFCVLVAGLIGIVGGASRAADATGNIDFNFQVRPILADRCFKCHGPDEKARKAKLRLDLPESAYAIRDPKTGTKAIVPHHPEQSELYRRITTTDKDDRMPPVASNLALTDEE